MVGLIPLTTKESKMPSPLMNWILNLILFAAGVATGYYWRNK